MVTNPGRASPPAPSPFEPLPAAEPVVAAPNPMEPLGKTERPAEPVIAAPLPATVSSDTSDDRLSDEELFAEIYERALAVSASRSA